MLAMDLAFAIGILVFALLAGLLGSLLGLGSSSNCACRVVGGLKPGIKAQGPRHGHPGPNPELTGCIRARGHNPALARSSANGKRLSAELRLAELFHGAEEGIQVKVEDGHGVIRGVRKRPGAGIAGCQ